MACPEAGGRPDADGTERALSVMCLERRIPARAQAVAQDDDVVGMVIDDEDSRVLARLSLLCWAPRRCPPSDSRHPYQRSCHHGCHAVNGWPETVVSPVPGDDLSQLPRVACPAEPPALRLTVAVAIPSPFGSVIPPDAGALLSRVGGSLGPGPEAGGTGVPTPEPDDCPRNRWTSATTARGSQGFARYPSQPTCIARSRSDASACAVKAMIGICRVSGSCFNTCVASQPL